MLIYLGMIVLGFGYFVWNKGVIIVNVGVLVVMNNLLILVGIIVNIVIWNCDVDIIKFVIGVVIILLVFIIN